MFTGLVAVIQARMGSQRFPGKVLKVFRGQPVLSHVLVAAADSLGRDNVILATSQERQDDPVAELARRGEWRLFRGSQDNVWSRFQEIARNLESGWIARICADSPLLPSSLIRTMAGLVNPQFDIVTNIYPRTFPRGQSVEILRRGLFLEDRAIPQTVSDKEHVTPHLYRLEGIRILNYSNPQGDQSALEWSVEEPEDILRLEKLIPS